MNNGISKRGRTYVVTWLSALHLARVQVWSYMPKTFYLSGHRNLDQDIDYPENGASDWHNQSSNLHDGASLHTCSYIT